MWIRHTVHKPPGRRRDGLGVVHRVRRAPRRARSCTSSPASDLQRAGGRLDRGRRARARVGPGGGRGGVRRRAAGRCDSRPRSPSCAICVAGLALPHAAAAHEADEPGAAARFDGVLELDGRRADRARRLARDGRPQLGLRARRALDLAARLRLRGRPGSMARRRARARARRVAPDAVGRQRRAVARRAARTGSAASARARPVVARDRGGRRAGAARRARAPGDRARSRSRPGAPRAGATQTPATTASTTSSTARSPASSWRSPGAERVGDWCCAATTAAHTSWAPPRARPRASRSRPSATPDLVQTDYRDSCVRPARPMQWHELGDSTWMISF